MRRKRPSSERSRRVFILFLLLAAMFIVLMALYGCRGRSTVWLGHGDLIFLPTDGVQTKWEAAFQRSPISSFSIAQFAAAAAPAMANTPASVNAVISSASD